MRALIALFLFFLAFIPAIGQNCNWAIRSGNPQDDKGWSIAKDANDNVYTTGSFTLLKEFSRCDLKLF